MKIDRARTAGAGPALLRLERMARGYSQSQLAVAAGVSVRTVRALELGAVNAPRAATLDMVVDALGLDPQRRSEFRAAWGLTHDRRTADPRDMVGRHGPADLLALVRRRMDAVTTVYARSSVTIGPHRQIARELAERVLVANQDGVTGQPSVYVAESQQALAAMTLKAGTGARYRARTTLSDGMVTVTEWDFGRHLRAGESHLYRFERTFRTPYPVPNPATGGDPWAGRCQLEGLHRQAKLCVVEAVFRLDDPPRRCVYLLQRSLDSGYEELRDVSPDPGGRAVLTVVDPVAGWHGLGWQW